MHAFIAAMLLLAVGSVHPPLGAELLRSANPHRQTPLWVPLSMAVTRQGDLSPDYFDEYALRDLHRFARTERQHIAANATNDDEVCLGERPAEIAASSDTLQDLTSNARAILEGEIVERTVGFFEDVPASLLTVRVTRALRRDAAFASTEVLVYYPEADFEVGPDHYCIRPATHAARPRVGDRVVVFAFAPAADAGGSVVYSQASKHLIFETAKGELIPPAGLRGELQSKGIRTLDDLLDRLHVAPVKTTGDHR